MKVKKSSKGQSSLEYMATYGWVILILLILGVVIWQSGILSVGKNISPGKSGFSQLRPFDWVASTSGQVNITIINDAGTKLTLQGASSTKCTGNPTYSVDLLPAQTMAVTLTGCSLTGEVGDYYKLPVTITYNNPSSTISHVSVGEIWGPLE